MPIEEELLREVQMQTAILRAAHRTALSDLADELKQDKTNGAIIDALHESSDPILGGELTRSVASTVDVSPRTVRLKVAQLTEFGVVRRLGAGRTTKYELTGLLG